MKRVRVTAAVAAPLVGWVLGMVSVFHRTLFSGLRLAPGAEGDPRHINFLLEHSWRWLVRDELHLSFASPPILWPLENTIGMSDLLIGFGPFYWLWRAFGAEPHLAMVLFVLLAWSLNFLAAHLMLRHCFRLAPAPAAAGAFVFAFSSPRIANIVHPQLIPQFLLVAAVVAIIRLLEDRERSRMWSAVLSGALVLQFFGAWNPFFVFGLAVVLTLCAALVVPQARRSLWKAFHRAWIPLVVSAGLAAIAVAPGIALHLQALDEIGPRSYNVKRQMEIASLWLPGTENIIYGGLYEGLEKRFEGSHHANGFGFVTTAVALVGLWIGRRDPRLRWVCLAVLILVVLSVSWDGYHSVWKSVIREWVPGASSIRAVARIGRFLLFPAALGVGFAASRLLERRRWVPAVLLAGVCIAEQLHHPLAYDRHRFAARERAIAEAVPDSCEAFYLTIDSKVRRKNSEDAIWAALTAGKPTLNSPFGRNPPDYHLEPAVGRPWSELQQRRIDLKAWIATNELDPDSVCWLHIDPLTEVIDVRTRPW